MSLSFDARLADRGFDISLRLKPGETLAVLGPNGAGKSTLLGLIAGLLRADAGRAELEGTVLFDDGPRARQWLAPHRRGVALLAQEPLLFPHLSVRANVEFGPRSTGASRAEAPAIAEHWMVDTETLEFADRRPHELSGGQAQRVAIARALAAYPRLLLLDEPFSALDVTATVNVRRMLRQVIAGLTTIIVTHDALDAFLLADRVIVLKDGAIVETGLTRDVLEHPKNPFTAELVGLTLLTGRRTVEGLVTDDGVEIAAAPDGLSGELDELVAAALRPAAVRVARVQPGAEVHATPGNNVILGTVHDVEPRGDLIRVRTEWLSADLQPRQVADLDLAPGVPIHLSFSPDDVVLYSVDEHVKS
ncbi:sulfate/molybdate ABC transporter ATP-binding protein [Leifsonia sp. A12D58]|uniref:sulfate/molybdate ABC transporter ATP-binding protein n=1 Tax=Leifsonia sp. A12D58 TaxID=3397674 RepID=UPI0039E10484